LFLELDTFLKLCYDYNTKMRKAWEKKQEISHERTGIKHNVEAS